MTKSKLVFIIVAVVLIGIQLVGFETTNPNVLADIQTPMEIKTILKNSCYDCHSNETKWPWYSKVAPISWYIIYDVNEGREALNFSDWDKLTTDKQYKLVGKIVQEIDEDEMPPSLYSIMHSSARLGIEKKGELKKWLQQSNN